MVDGVARDVWQRTVGFGIFPLGRHIGERSKRAIYSTLITKKYNMSDRNEETEAASDVSARSFNPSNDEVVDGIKSRVNDLAAYITDNVTDSRRRRKALTDLEQASMWAVKANFYTD